MSYKSREKKRRIKIAVARAKREHQDVMATRYYRTLVKHLVQMCRPRLSAPGR